MNIVKCDICGEPMAEGSNHIWSARLGGQLIDIKVGIHNIQKGDQCPDCIKKALQIIVERGIFVNHTITIPGDVQPIVPEVKEKNAWGVSLTHS